MASKTKKLKIVRKHKAARSGKKRKAALRTKGSTRTAKELFGE